MNSYYSESELKQLGLKAYGNNVLISRKASIYEADRIEIGSNVRIDDYTIISGNIKIRDYIHIAPYTALYGGKSGILLNDFVTLSSRIAIYAESDDYSGMSLTFPSMEPSFRRCSGGMVTLEKHVIVGTGSTIMPSVIIGTGSAVGTMSYVNRSLDSWGIFAGIPCRRISDRSRKIQEPENQFLGLKGECGYEST